jgi:hypothetical protein
VPNPIKRLRAEPRVEIPVPGFRAVDEADFSTSASTREGAVGCEAELEGNEVVLAPEPQAAVEAALGASEASATVGMTITATTTSRETGLVACAPVEAAPIGELPSALVSMDPGVGAGTVVEVDVEVEDPTEGLTRKHLEAALGVSLSLSSCWRCCLYLWCFFFSGSGDSWSEEQGAGSRSCRDRATSLGG